MKKLFGLFSRPEPEDSPISWVTDPAEGVAFVITPDALQDPAAAAIKNLLFGLQLTILKSLLEQDLAYQNSNGFTVKSEIVAELEDDFFEAFGLPESFSGSFECKPRGAGLTTKSDFGIDLNVRMPDGDLVSNAKLYGPFLKVSNKEIFRLSPVEYRALKAIEHHDKLDLAGINQYENNWLMFALQNAAENGMRIDLSHFKNLELVHPEKVGVSVEELVSGDLLITPSYGAGISPGDVRNRLGQLGGDQESEILRVNNKFVLLDKARLEKTREILTCGRIPKEQVSHFLSSPTSYLNAALVDLDLGFSLRAHGAERFSHRYFGDMEKSGVDWFSADSAAVQPFENVKRCVDSEGELQELKGIVADARANDADTISFGGDEFEISDHDKVDSTLNEIGDEIEVAGRPELVEHECESSVKQEQAVVAIDSNDEEDDFSVASQFGELDVETQQFDCSNLKRTPFPHQNDGIKWILAHIDRAKKQASSSGALLADDMGLGKTFMVLVAINEYYQRCKESGDTQKPTLLVAPLSLLENWRAEIEETFYKSPFSSITILQSGSDLKTYRVAGAGKETRQNFDGKEGITAADEIRYSLKVGSVYGSGRLDMPSRLVLTTYDTLRDYQFSLSRVDWGIVAFDEAQNLKNPNTLASRSAKALKAELKLLATGTPVENSLKDFWNLLDTAVPGLLGAWKDFQRDYIKPILSADKDQVLTEKIRVGKELRQRVDQYMLRRSKENNLEGLPTKTIFSGVEGVRGQEYDQRLSGIMDGKQLDQYDAIIDEVKNTSSDDKRKVVLPSLSKLKVVSIHPDLIEKRPDQIDVGDVSISKKIKILVSILGDIKRRDEKVLVFSTTKAVQALACSIILSKLGILPDVINGDTKAVSNRKGQETRKGIIDKFQSKEGFDVLVMSPVAAGVGLTIVGANNVIHLERHWNPAKEAQATDRVYRIGQKKPVNVYLPIVHHPEIRSFDVQLNALLNNKTDLSEAVVVASSVEKSELLRCF